MRNAMMVVVLLAGCGGGGGSSVALSDLPAKDAHAYCAKAASCCTMAEFTAKFQGFNPPITDEASCESAFTALLQGLAASEQASISAGKITYNGSNAGCFIDALNSMSCTEFATEGNGSAT